MDGASSPKKATDTDWSKFEELLEISECQLSGSSSGNPDQLDKICVIINYSTSCFCHSNITEFFLYVIDVNNSPISSQILSLKPVICWNLLEINLCAYGTLGSKLFFFGELVFKPEDDYLMWGYDTYYYDMKGKLNLDVDSPIRLTEKSLVKGPKMSGRKEYPFAVKIGDSKICVFAKILYDSEKTHQYRPNFELLCDSTTDDFKFKVLGEPLIYENLDSSYKQCVYISSYCVHRSCLIINICGEWVYGINFDHPHPKWVSLDQSLTTSFPFNRIFELRDEILCNGFYMMKGYELIPHPIELEGPPIRNSLHITQRINATCFDDRCNTFCLAYGAFDRAFNFNDCCNTTDVSYLLVDIVKFEVTNLLKVKIKRSFTFQLPKYWYASRMRILACLPIKDASFVAGNDDDDNDNDNDNDDDDDNDDDNDEEEEEEEEEAAAEEAAEGEEAEEMEKDNYEASFVTECEVS